MVPPSDLFFFLKHNKNGIEKELLTINYMEKLILAWIFEHQKITTKVTNLIVHIHSFT